MVSEALAYAYANGIGFAINRNHLLPLPPLCPLTLDSLVDGEEAQAPVLARLVDTEGFTPESTVVLSVRSKRRHQVLSARGLRENLGKSLTRLQSIVVAEAVSRFNHLCWEAEVIDITTEIDHLEVDSRGLLVVPPLGRRAKHAADTVQNWCDLISDDAGREYIAAGHRLPPEREPPQQLSLNLRMTKTPAEWLEWAEEVPSPAEPWRIPKPQAPKYVQLSF
ncbi:hypothetical protein QTH90_06265 [Variovorax sp. J2P1-59]|uniref:hypothetical protein n=1 Tax=Variovorax flavidus TaxID=3053501 RepID=UPI002575C89B|nr:hypothetical protein [Variovorax sp. J2P1-59]MDM0073978.1 hypothetical protein [Variovorax sp. J2P1-59]